MTYSTHHIPRRMTSLISIELLGNVIVQPRLPGDHHHPTSPPKTPRKSPTNHPELPHPRPIRADLTLPGVCGYEDSILAQRLSTLSSGRLHDIHRWQRVPRICAGLLATCAIQAIISHRADSSRIGISTISLAQYRRTRPSQPNSREITTAPQIHPKLPRSRPHQQLPEKQAPVARDDIHTTGVISKRVRCRPNSRTKEIRLPANQASAGPTSCRIRWSAALRMRHQHRVG